MRDGHLTRSSVIVRAVVGNSIAILVTVEELFSGEDPSCARDQIAYSRRVAAFAAMGPLADVTAPAPVDSQFETRTSGRHWAVPNTSDIARPDP
jgi:hypothetical protein